MEPRLLRRGNDHPLGWSAWKKRLQWSHAFSDVETQTARGLFTRNAELLQWSHAFSDVETHGHPVLGEGNSMLQWSHAFSDVETGLRLTKYQADSGASMEPRLLRRGNTTELTFRQQPRLRFNGATPSQTWKRLPRRTLSAAAGCFNGATPSQTWKPLAAAALIRAPPCFNGATPSQTWKQWDAHQKAAADKALQWSHAFSDVETQTSQNWRRPAHLCFNGATPSQTWKLWRELLDGLDALRASMEPRLLRRGNLPRPQRNGFMEGASMEPRLLRRGNSGRGSGRNRRRKGFNGATPSQTWKRRTGRNARGGGGGFNGATPSQTWKPCVLKPLPAICT